MKPKMLVLNRVVEDLLKMVRRLIGEKHRAGVAAVADAVRLAGGPEA